MPPPEINWFPELDALVVRLEGTLTANSYIALYDAVLQHPRFKKNTNFIWNATHASLEELTLKDFKQVVEHVKKSESLRGKSLSAWVFSRGKSYENACLFNAAFGIHMSIRYEIFNNFEEAKEWLRTHLPKNTPRKPIV